MSSETNKKNIIFAVLGIIVIIAAIAYYQHRENTIEGRIGVIKDLKMSDIADVRK